MHSKSFSFLTITFCAFNMAWAAPDTFYGDRSQLGDGYFRTYIQKTAEGAIDAIGVEFDESSLMFLPRDATDGNNCFDLDGDNFVNLHDECMGGHQRILFLPMETEKTPFKWVLLNWNPHGHIPMGIYTVPHFDFHFYMQNYTDRNLIRPGRCSMLVDCNDYLKGKVPVPTKFMPPGYSDVDAVEVRMGNHLIDLSSPEFQPQGEFSHTFIFGAYEGRITFWEPMITMDFFQKKTSSCTDISLPQAYDAAGYYPTKYCIRYTDRNTYTVSLEGMQLRKADF